MITQTVCFSCDRPIAFCKCWGGPVIVTKKPRKMNMEMAGLAPEYTIPMILTCPMCNTRHIEEGEFALKPHHTHACQKCGTVWRPAKVNTHGVQFLPGYKS